MQIHNWLTVLVPALVSFCAVNWVHLKILHIAKEKNMVDNPDARKLQKIPVPVLGGIAVFFGLVLGLLASAVMDPSLNLMPLILACSLMLYVGALDDMLNLSPFVRIVLEVLAILGLIYGTGICADNLHGMWGVHEIPWSIGVPLTVFAGVGIINAVNMVDGVNGLSSGLCITCSLLFGFLFWHCGDWVNAIVGFTFAGALIPFLLHNVFGKHSRMFIGDSGTMVMGLIVTWFVMNMLTSQSSCVVFNNVRSCNLIALALAIESVPVCDTVRVMVSRVLHGNSPFQADRTHLHHVFIALGVSHSITALTEIVLGLLVVLIWFISYQLGVSIDNQLYVVLITDLILVVGVYNFLHWHEKNHTRFFHAFKHFSISTHLGHRHWWLAFQAFLDRGAEKSPFEHNGKQDKFGKN